MPVPQPAYRSASYPDYRPSRSQGVEVIRGNRRAPESRPQSSSLITLARSIAVVLIVAAVVCCVRIALTSATVSTLIEGDELSTQITEMRSTGTQLEMQKSNLTSPSSLTGAAKKLGMAAPVEVGTIALATDVVATDAQGNLSFAGTVKNVVGTQG